MPALNSAIAGLSAAAFGISLASLFVPGPAMAIVAMLLTAAVFVLAMLVAQKMKRAGMTRHEPTPRA